MLTELSFIFLFQGIELSLIAVEIIVVWLLSEVAHDLAWGIIEISWPSISIEALGLVARLFTWRVIVLGLLIRVLLWCLFIVSFTGVSCCLIQINVLRLLWCLRIWWSLFTVLPLLLGSWLMLLLPLFFFFFTCLCCVANHCFKSFCLRFIIH